MLDGGEKPKARLYCLVSMLSSTGNKETILAGGAREARAYNLYSNLRPDQARSQKVKAV